MVVNDFATAEIECKQARGSYPVVAVVDGPEPALPVDGNTKHGIEQLRLPANIRIRYCCSIGELEQLVAFGSCFGVHREENAARLAYRNITDR
jgi:hypothetical protein